MIYVVFELAILTEVPLTTYLTRWEEISITDSGIPIEIFDPKLLTLFWK